MLPPTIPIFSLPNVVLFPNVFLPLHVFEPRYQAMLAAALDGDRIVGMTLLQPGYEANYADNPAVYSIGCAGVITHAEPLSKGRSNIVLRGIEKFRIVGEDQHLPYRQAHVEGLPEPLPDGDRVAVARHRNKLEALLAVAMERSGTDPKFPPAVADEDLVNALAQYLQLDPLERQALLECEGILARCRGLIELLEMKSLAPRGEAWKGRSVH